MPNSLPSEADIVLAGYQTGYYSIDDVIAWADRWILALDEPPTELLDLSMGRDLNPVDVNNLLRSLGRHDEREIVEYKLGLLGRRYLSGGIATDQALELLDHLQYDDAVTRLEHYQITWMIEEHYGATAQDIGNLVDVGRQLRQFLGPYVQLLKLFAVPEQ